MIHDKISAGQRFHWREQRSGNEGEAVVSRVLNDRQVGMSTEVDQYVALWIEATGTAGNRAGEKFTVTLQTDGRSFIEGEPIDANVH